MNPLEREVIESRSTGAIKHFFLFIAVLGRCMGQSTDVAGNGTSRRPGAYERCVAARWSV